MSDMGFWPLFRLNVLPGHSEPRLGPSRSPWGQSREHVEGTGTPQGAGVEVSLCCRHRTPGTEGLSRGSHL